VVITRFLALYQPCTELNRGHSSSAASFGLKYTNLPPVLIAPRALAGRHYILSLASAVVLASNGLAVALGSLFNNIQLPIDTVVALEFPLYPSIDNQVQTGGIGITTISANVSGPFAMDTRENLLISYASRTDSIRDIPWVESRFYFLPFKWNPTVGGVYSTWSANTWGLA